MLKYKSYVCKTLSLKIDIFNLANKFIFQDNRINMDTFMDMNILWVDTFIFKSKLRKESVNSRFSIDYIFTYILKNKNDKI